MFRPSTYPNSARPLRKAVILGTELPGDLPLTNPTTGIAGCCARAPTGHAAAAPPSSVRNSRRLMPIMGFDPSRALPGVRHDSSNRAALARGLPHLEPAVEGPPGLLAGPELF